MKGAWSLFLALLVVGCASDPPASSGDDDDDDPSSDEARKEAEKKTDQTGGRDTTGPSCFAACQNSSMTCTSKSSAKTVEVFLELDSFKGCKGTYGAKTLVINCLAEKDEAPQVCIDDTCEDGTFSAFTFGFDDSVCTKNN